MNSCSNKRNKVSNNRSHESNKTSDDKTSHEDKTSDEDDDRTGHEDNRSDKTSHEDNYDDNSSSSSENDGNAKVFIIESVTTDVSNNITHHCADEDSDTTGETEVASSSVQDTGITVNEEAQDSVQGHSKHFIG